MLHTYDAARLDRLGRELGTPGAWIKVTGEPETLRGLSVDGWTVDVVGYLMTVSFGTGTVAPPDPYRIRVEQVGAVLVATVSDRDGAPASVGRLAPAGAYGIVDQVTTEPAHRRRGLGSVVMGALGAEAVARGLRTGILVATDDGRALYRSLGWTARSPIAGAFRPER